MALPRVGIMGDESHLPVLPPPSRSTTPDSQDSNRANWMSHKSLPQAVQPWLPPPPLPVKLAPVPRIGEVAPLDRGKRLQFGRRSKCLVVFLRCVGCAFARKTFLQLRDISSRYAGTITCIAVSHASERATNKWIDMLGGSRNAQMVIDQERAIYAAWGLSTASSIWYVLGPSTQVRSWQETGWLGDQVAGAIQRGEGEDEEEVVVVTGTGRGRYREGKGKGYGGMEKRASTMSTIMGGLAELELGSKWQEAGAFAVDGRGTVVWGGKAESADDVMRLDEGVRLLLL
ncbi:hypothetical protein A9Z42_0003890 [Trichoderma parareesei]|uniref:Alkyl hydroperoxide reductase subunit C/ Thiol specific antioxidant domain-containing protein n=1 Tax=Trichoderma parareesei TaxID=858221 RepID=A0A2H3AA13_TRIPA|nr:hypothetical protein A9Z42_0003890 [Trichoderma parareesei]